MATLNIDVEKAAKKMETELSLRPMTALIMAKNLFNLHEDLFPVIEKWYEGTRVEIEFNGITLDYIMKKERTPYIDAVYTMSWLMENPNRIDFYKERTFDKE